MSSPLQPGIRIATASAGSTCAPASARGVSKAELVGSMRQAASVSGVSPFVVRRWISQRVLAEPPWTLDQVKDARDTQDPALRSQAAHGTSARWNDGCSCATCRRAHNDLARTRKRANAQARLPVEVRQMLLCGHL